MLLINKFFNIVPQSKKMKEKQNIKTVYIIRKKKIMVQSCHFHFFFFNINFQQFCITFRCSRKTSNEADYGE